MLTQSLNSKLCSDFANQAAVIGNSAELIDSRDDKIKEEALSIVSKASQKMIDLLEIYRYGYSPIDPLRETNVTELNGLIKKYLDTEGLKAEFSLITKTNDIGYLYGKLAVCFLLAISPQSVNDCFIEFNLEHLDEIRFRLIYKNPMVQLINQAFEELNSDESKIDDSNCRKLYLTEVAMEKGYVASTAKFPGVVEYRLDKVH